MKVWKKIFGYINVFGKKDPDAPKSINLSFMHGINRISIFMFLAAMIYLIVRAVMRS
ncbi:MAG: DUF6728 family protein [Bacteroidota bacterium]